MRAFWEVGEIGGFGDYNSVYAGCECGERVVEFWEHAANHDALLLKIGVEVAVDDRNHAAVVVFIAKHAFFFEAEH